MSFSSFSQLDQPRHTRQPRQPRLPVTIRIEAPDRESTAYYRGSIAEKAYHQSRYGHAYDVEYRRSMKAERRRSMQAQSRQLYARTSVYSTVALNDPSLIAANRRNTLPVVSPKPLRSKTTNFFIIVGFCLLAIAASLESVIVSTALPSIKEHLSSGSSDDYAWVGSAYLLVSTSMLPVWARLSDIYGRRPAMIAADIFFIAGSVIAAMAGKMEVLLLGRAVQGLGGGGLLVMINICTTDMYSLRERGLYIAIFGGISAITASAAPVLGGWFAQNLSWRWCFWVNVPLCAAALVLIAIFLRIELPPPTHGLKSIDWLGVLTVTGGTVNSLVGLQMGGITHPWGSAIILGLVSSGGVLFLLFIITEWKISRYPLVPGRIVARSTNMAYLAISFCHGFTYISVVYYLPVYFQLVLNATPIHSGIWLLPTALSMGVASVIAGTIIKRSGRYIEVTWVAVFFVVVGFGMFITLPTRKEWPRMIAVQVLVGFGLGPLFQAPLIGLLSGTCSEDIAAANSLYSFLRSLGSALSIVVGQVMIQHWLQTQSSDLLDAGIPAALVAKFTHDFTELDAVKSGPHPLTAAMLDAIRDALNTAMKSAWMIYATVAFFACCFAATVPREPLVSPANPDQPWKEMDDFTDES